MTPLDLRPELMPPILEKAKVARLAKLAARIDGSGPGQYEDDLAEFNREAGTALEWIEFQGIYGGQDHDTRVQKVLGQPYQKRIPDITRAELIEMARRVMENEGEEHETAFWLGMLEENLPDPDVSDLIYWPGEYFGDGDNSSEMTPEQVIDIALRRDKGDDSRESPG